MIKVLLIGCGYIGSFSDIHSDNVTSYAKAFSALEVDLYVYDIDSRRSLKTAIEYAAKQVTDIDSALSEAFDLCIISTPTPTHGYYLIRCLSGRINTILCEKPLASDIDELDSIQEAYVNSGKRVFVNYHRRFLPSILSLKKFIASNNLNNSLLSASIHYQRGLLNNGTHALDLLNFLFDLRFVPLKLSIHSSIADEFKYDPTVSLTCSCSNSLITMHGIEYAKYSMLDISMFFEKYAIHLRNGCDQILIQQSIDSSAPPYPLPKTIFHDAGCMNNFMKHIAYYMHKIVNNRSVPDNFNSSLDLTKTTLSLISSIQQ